MQENVKAIFTNLCFLIWIAAILVIVNAIYPLPLVNDWVKSVEVNFK